MATEETRLEVYANAAGLLSRMGYHARVIPDYNRPPITGPVVALSTDVEGVLVGYAIAMVAENPETFLPTTRMPGGRIPGSTKGPPLGVWFWCRPRAPPALWAFPAAIPATLSGWPPTTRNRPGGTQP